MAFDTVLLALIRVPTSQEASTSTLDPSCETLPIRIWDQPATKKQKKESTRRMAFGMSVSFVKSMAGKPSKWMSQKVSSLRQKKKAQEANMLKPIALAGASRGFSGRSQLCNSFARTQILQKAPSLETSSVTLEEDEDEGAHSARSNAARDDAREESQWKPCEMCKRRFLRRDSKFAEFCSLDCKSAAYLGVDAYQQ